MFKVEILDPALGDKKGVVEDSLTIHVLQYLQEGRYFTEANLLPGRMGREDLLLRFHFDQYQQVRSIHPAAVPAALLTLTLYIWFGGPMYTDSSNLSGRLAVEDARGIRVAEVSSRVSEEHTVSFLSPEYFLPSGIEGRTSIVKDLVNRAITEIRQKGR